MTQTSLKKKAKQLCNINDGQKDNITGFGR